MATSADYMEFVLERLSGFDNVRCRKTFGEYMVYVEDKPIFTVCDNTVFVKKLPEAAELMKDCSLGFPYDSAKEHLVLDIEDGELLKKLVPLLVRLTPVPQKRKR